MKKNFSYFFAVVFSVSMLIFSCAGTSGAKADKKHPQAPVVRAFDDWQYKGFGKEYPEWAELALEGKTEELQKYFSHEDMELVIVTAEGVDSDMCRHLIAEKSYSEEEAWLVEETWVRKTDDNMYVYIKIFLMRRS
ncbi:MAG: hypothetical protein K5907_04625 [Treponema sp.]|nr:hypothetical protein [Treponema sp.]